MKKYLLLIALVLSGYSFANEVSGISTIKNIKVYPEYGGGDFLFQIVNPSSTCQGYWLNTSMSGFDGTVSTLLSAYHASTKIRVYAKPEDQYRWQGSSATKYCKLHLIILEK